ncbi:Protein FAR1-RELATED SEQUENCE 5 [Bienertia sinuspersici]
MKEWIPYCSIDLKPYVGMQFFSIEDELKFYKTYAKACGFNVRKATTTKSKKGDVAFKYFLCNKAGFKEKQRGQVLDNLKDNQGDDVVVQSSSISRKRLVTHVGCKAKMVLKFFNKSSYVVTIFHEGHTHPLYTPSSRKFQKGCRKISMLHKKMIFDNSKVNIGPVKTFRLMKEYVGGYENVGASKEDFKNFHRDLKAYIEGSDAQMFVDNFKMKRLLWSAYFFDYEVDEDDCLCRAFWADPICRRNYSVFGDMVSFDTTYQFNKYNMIFGPFTGVDHHKRCVTFAGSFITKEDVSSFEWLFNTFLKGMGGKEPVCLITDQDPAMGIAIKNVFSKTKHRYCMWHIMKKMPDKVGRAITKETDFLEKLCACVWSLEIEPGEFERSWKSIMCEFGLQSHDWLGQIYDIRKLWIPAYFRDLFMGGIMRTTSRSESENNFFTCFTNPHVTLVEFYMRYESAMDAQRHSLSNFDNDSKNKYPELKTPLLIDKHASQLYTTTVFYELQYEIEIACFNCGFDGFRRENELEFVSVKEGSRRTYEVVFNCNNYDTHCSCKMFERQGLPCRHMIFVWKGKLLDKILEKYVLNRWTIMATKQATFSLEGHISDQCVKIVDKKRILNEVWSEIHNCVSLAEDHEDDLIYLLNNLKALKLDLESKKDGNVPQCKKTKDIEFLIRASAPNESTIKPPKISKNKGSGEQFSSNVIAGAQRLKGEKEKAME